MVNVHYTAFDYSVFPRLSVAFVLVHRFEQLGSAAVAVAVALFPWTALAVLEL